MARARERRAGPIGLVPVALLLAALYASPPAEAGGPGTLDRSFGSGGTVVTNFLGPRYADVAKAVAIDSQKRIVTVGGTIGPRSSEVIVARYRPDGHLDRSFSGNGKARTAFDEPDAAGSSVAIDARDRIVVAGRSCAEYPDCDFALARYTRSGNLDPSFGFRGKVTTDLGSGSVNSVAIDHRGRIVAAGGTAEPYQGGEFALARYRRNGDLDHSFGAGGLVTTQVATEGVANSVAIDGQGRIVAAGVAVKGIADNETGLARYEPNGSLDRSFGGGGIVTTNFGRRREETRSVAIDGRRIVVAGFRETSAGDRFKLARYRRDGHFDYTSFSNEVGGIAESVAIDARGRIVVVGFERAKNGHKFRLARFTSGGDLDRHFSRNGEVSRPRGMAHSVASGPRGRIVAGGAGAKKLKLARYIG
jgi:uncharacterized delta-60 repeat protein